MSRQQGRRPLNALNLLHLQYHKANHRNRKQQHYRRAVHTQKVLATNITVEQRVKRQRRRKHMKHHRRDRLGVNRKSPTQIKPDTRNRQHRYHIVDENQQ